MRKPEIEENGSKFGERVEILIFLLRIIFIGHPYRERKPVIPSNKTSSMGVKREGKG